MAFPVNPNYLDAMEARRIGPRPLLQANANPPVPATPLPMAGTMMGPKMIPGGMIGPPTNGPLIPTNPNQQPQIPRWNPNLNMRVAPAGMGQIPGAPPFPRPARPAAQAVTGLKGNPNKKKKPGIGVAKAMTGSKQFIQGM